MQNNLIIGGSTGDFHRIIEERNTDKLVSEYFAIPETNAIEIMFHGHDNKIEHQMTKEITGNHFSHYSVHASSYHIYKNDKETHDILNFLKEFITLLPVTNIVVHPNDVEDRSVFEKYPELPISIENMDERKNFGRTIQDIGKILKKYPNFGLTLDLQHCYVNDPSMQLADDFHKEFGNRIVQYHLSGYEPKLMHYPLFKTKQTEIIKALKFKNIPIVIESTFDDKSDLKNEIEYIHNFI